MECIVTRFVTALREAGLRVSPGETLDAVRAIVLGGVGERSSAKAMLRMTLVKRVADFPYSIWYSIGFSGFPTIANSAKSSTTF